MKKIKTEMILIILLTPILGYVGWQAYNTYIKSPELDIEHLKPTEINIGKKITEPAENSSNTLLVKTESKGTLGYSGYTSRDPLSHSLPTKTDEPLPQPDMIKQQQEITIPEREEETVKEEAEKEIALPTFKVSGLVWGNAPPRAIIDNNVYKTGDTIKGAKILSITKCGIQMIYKGKQFWVNVFEGG